jgi:hypothetical protein
MHPIDFFQITKGKFTAHQNIDNLGMRSLIEASDSEAAEVELNLLDLVGADVSMMVSIGKLARPFNSQSHRLKR